jgi:hypothetical protein
MIRDSRFKPHAQRSRPVKRDADIPDPFEPLERHPAFQFPRSAYTPGDGLTTKERARRIRTAKRA